VHIYAITLFWSATHVIWPFLGITVLPDCAYLNDLQEKGSRLSHRFCLLRKLEVNDEEIFAHLSLSPYKY